VCWVLLNGANLGIDLGTRVDTFIINKFWVDGNERLNFSRILDFLKFDEH
jgi:hypothetical protein